jgi:protein involved in polysaccharide export with SLBB domain
MFITVGGEVRKPGQLQINETAQLYAVIQSAGGPTEFGSMRKVKILRNGASTEYDLEDDTQKTTPVMPNDVIEIPKKNLIGR